MTYLANQKQKQIGIINNDAGKAYQQAVENFPSHEMLTWSMQFEEASAPGRKKPMLSAIAKAEGIKLEEVVERVKIQGEMFAKITGSIVGRRLNLLRKIAEITDENPDEPSQETIEALSKITW